MTAASIRVQTPAKVNPVLEVLGKRADGYHELVLLFQAIGLYDEVSIAPAKEGVRLELSPLVTGLAPDDSNLAVRAAKLFQREALGGKEGVQLSLKKAIPLAAGLGGGSSDAAAVLWGMNEVFGAGLSLERLQGLAERIGSDVPFFLHGGLALGWGRGEKIESLPAGPPLFLILVKPLAGLSTPAVYRSGKLVFTSGDKARAFPEAWRKGGPQAAASGFFNGLEPASLFLMPEIEGIKNQLVRAGALGALVSGSGPTVFGVAPTEEEASRIAGKIQGLGWTVWVAPTVSTGIQRIDI